MLALRPSPSLLTTAYLLSNVLLACRALTLSSPNSQIGGPDLDNAINSHEGSAKLHKRDEDAAIKAAAGLAFPLGLAIFCGISFLWYYCLAPTRNPIPGERMSRFAARRMKGRMKRQQRKAAAAQRSGAKPATSSGRVLWPADRAAPVSPAGEIDYFRDLETGSADGDRVSEQFSSGPPSSVEEEEEEEEVEGEEEEEEDLPPYSPRRNDSIAPPAYQETDLPAFPARVARVIDRGRPNAQRSRRDVELGLQ